MIVATQTTQTTVDMVSADLAATLAAVNPKYRPIASAALDCWNATIRGGSSPSRAYRMLVAHLLSEANSMYAPTDAMVCVRGILGDVSDILDDAGL